MIYIDIKHNLYKKEKGDVKVILVNKNHTFNCVYSDCAEQIFTYSAGVSILLFHEKCCCKKGHQIKARFEYLGQPIASQNDISLKLNSGY